MFKILDRYIIKKFLTTFFFMLGIIMLFAIVFDISAKLSDFIQRNATVYGVVVDYYLNFAIYYGNMFSPLIVFVSVIWFTSKMAQDTEIIPILNSGRPFRRILRPYMIGATILTLISLMFNHLVLPYANKTRLKFEENYYRDVHTVHDYFADFPGNQIVYFDSYRSDKSRVLGFVIENRDKNHRLQSLLEAHKAINPDSTHEWKLYNYHIRYIGYPNDSLVYNSSSGKYLDTVFPFQLAKMVQRNTVIQTMGYSELKHYIKSQKEMGSANVAMSEMELYKRTSFPFATFVLTLIGLSVSSRKSRGGIGGNIAIGLFLVFVFIFTMKVTAVAAENVGLPPIIAVWIPNLIFGVIGIVLYRLAPK